VPELRVRLVPPLPASSFADEPDEHVTRLARRFAEILRIGDGRAADALITDALADRVAPEIIQSFVITPAMTTVGELWERGELGIAEEHLATAISQKALVRLHESMASRRGRVRSGGSVLLAAVEGQHHVLGLKMVADVLDSAGYHVLYLGPDVPVSSLRAFALDRQPAVAGLTFGIAANIKRLADSLWALHEVSPDTRIMLGGRAVPTAFQSAYRYVSTSTDVREAVESLLQAPAQPMPRLVGLLRSDAGHSSDDVSTVAHDADGAPTHPY
jgi:MerR family transcriptional regulator, light-induced transcriptional regulator